ncbi:MAG: site-specific DNA-methyltransferase [Fimbriimonadia bacterium]|jgi:site-specific DNA-methyltransferase (adenine-specific)
MDEPRTTSSIDVRANTIVLGESLETLRLVPDCSIQLVYIDPPFNTGITQRKLTMTVTRDDLSGDRKGFGGRRYRTEVRATRAYTDKFDDYLGFLEPRMRECRRVLTATGSFFLHIDYREVHYCKVLLDEVFGRGSFMNEIIWAYDYGARSKRRWPAKHDNILWYVKDPENYVFDFEAMDRIPYMAPGLVGSEKAARGKTPTDVWWHTIVPPGGKEQTGYPNQKPLGILERIIKVHSRRGDCVLDFFAGSGTTGEAAARHGRRFLLVDNNPEAAQIMSERLSCWCPVLIGFEPARAEQGTLAFG